MRIPTLVALALVILVGLALPRSAPAQDKNANPATELLN
jgi:hypothetical protein